MANRSPFSNPFYIKMDKNDNIYQQYSSPSIMDPLKRVGVDSYYDDFYLLNKNTIGLKKHIFNNPNWDPEKFKELLLNYWLDSGVCNGYWYLMEDQVSFEKDKIVFLDGCNDVCEIHRISIIVPITEDDPYYEQALAAYRGDYFDRHGKSRL